ncbi:MAG: DUF3343 domain-containing protein [Lachnospiraceae bacterium]|nr:DUF3343 domain-containing protein [Lachnospiraceae bacterium]MCD8362683.1 DUF3343 domain-containing protein [Lachnospiraceae bacterium]
MSHYIATFYSHFGAIRFGRELRAQGLKGTIMPVPRNLSSSCGTCVEFVSESADFHDQHGEIEQIVRVTDMGYECVYRAEDS